ncbi:MAG: hypothetical protein HFJ33_02115 [Clostridia bacterium]|nr:hypothetical protein [Clostridia bacterium]
MKNKKENKLYWRRLDNSAKIFPISTGKKYSTVFRLSAVLKEKVEPEILEEAVNQALEKYQSFKVRMKPGVFWYYLEHNTKTPNVEQECDYPCKYIESRKNHNYLFKVTYFQNKINIDIFHSLTDGNSGTTFFKEIIYTYLELMYPETFNEEERKIRKIEYDTEDSYMKNYDKKAKSNASSKKAYILRGKKIPLGAISVIHEIIDLEDLKRECKKQDATITQYLTAVLIESIYQENDGKAKGKKPIKICIPVNLKKYFPSKTISNFFSYITVEAEMKKEQLDTFQKILAFVKKDFAKKLTEEEIIKTMSTNVKIGNNPLIRPIPLFLKKAIVRLSYIEIRKYTTTTFSNIGRIGIIGKYKDYIDYFLMLIAPEPVEKIKCSSCTFENKMVFTFTSILQDNRIEKRFYQFLKERGIKIQIESNGVLDDISREDKSEKK